MKDPRMNTRNTIPEAVKFSLGPLLLATAAILLGTPSYLFLERWTRASPALLHRPWPRWIAEAALALSSIAVALRAGKRARRRVALGALGVALASGGGLAAATTRDLPAAPSAIALGQPLPDMTLVDELGRSIPLASLRGHPAVLVFYRGALCVACRAQLSALSERASSFIAEGVRVFGISADPPSVSAEWKKEMKLPFSLLSDPPQRLVQSTCSARAHCLLLIDPEGKVRWGALNDYWRGSESAESVLLAAYRLGAP
jgi:peroxiredoxin